MRYQVGLDVRNAVRLGRQGRKGPPILRELVDGISLDRLWSWSSGNWGSSGSERRATGFGLQFGLDIDSFLEKYSLQQ